MSGVRGGRVGSSARRCKRPARILRTRKRVCVRGKEKDHSKPHPSCLCIIIFLLAGRTQKSHWCVSLGKTLSYTGSGHFTIE